MREPARRTERRLMPSSFWDGSCEGSRRRERGMWAGGGGWLAVRGAASSAAALPPLVILAPVFLPLVILVAGGNLRVQFRRARPAWNRLKRG
jgi:hypothetical protein